MKAAEVRTKSDDELKDKVKGLKQELFNLRFQQASGQLEKTARVRQARREIAQAKTLLNERKLGIEPVAKKAAKAKPAAEKKAKKPAAKKKAAAKEGDK